MQQSNLDEQTITLESEDGTSYACRILGVFEFEEKEYALLLNLGNSENPQETEEGKDASTVIMQLIEKDDQAIFRTIESDEEFERVVAYVKELATDFGADEDEEE